MSIFPHRTGAGPWVRASLYSATFHVVILAPFLVPFVRTPADLSPPPPPQYRSVVVPQQLTPETAESPDLGGDLGQVEDATGADVDEPTIEELAAVETELPQAETPAETPDEFPTFAPQNLPAVDPSDDASSVEPTPPSLDEPAELEPVELAPVDVSGSGLTPSGAEDAAPNSPPVEELAAVTPQSLDIETSPFELPNAVAVSPQIADPGTDESSANPEPPDLSPVQPETPQISGSQDLPEVLNAVIDQGTEVQTASLPPTQELAAVDAPETSIAPVTTLSSQPNPPPTQPQGGTANQPPPDPDLVDLIQRIRASLEDRCFLALASGGDGVPIRVLMVSDNEQVITDFENAALDATPFELTRIRQVVDPLQCEALDYLRAHPNYPVYRLQIGLNASEIQSGSNLQGVVQGVRGRALTLLIVDDNGVVQDLRRFVTQFGNEYRFDIPMTRDGDVRVTRQLLVALATTRPLAAITETDGQFASIVFQAISAELDAGFGAGVTTFDVR